eukprot:14429821-Alexandrium_andersonii.AAC.1
MPALMRAAVRAAPMRGPLGIVSARRCTRTWCSRRGRTHDGSIVPAFNFSGACARSEAGCP